MLARMLERRDADDGVRLPLTGLEGTGEVDVGGRATSEEPRAVLWPELSVLCPNWLIDAI
jgi:hypothetical protein